MFFEYAKMIGEIILQIFSVIGRGIIVLLSCGLAAVILFFIEFIISLAIPEDITSKNWFSNTVIIICMIVGILVAFATAKALFNF